jgi:hypothetical protein
MDSRKKKKTVTRTFSAAASLVFVCAVVLSTGCSGSSDSSSPPPPPPPPTYTGTLYMASEAGGHVAVVPVTIDPSNATAPIVVNAAGLDRIQLSTTSAANNTTHIFHDVRLDGTKLYYSAIFTDGSGANPGMAHLGYVDTVTKTVHDAMIDATAEATAGMVYCGSGQSATHFFPMTMSSPAYIDAIAKSAIVSGATLSSTGTSVKRTLIESFRASRDPNYLFAHGVNSPDHTKLYVAVNEATSSAMTGSITSYLMNTSDVVAGTVTSSNVTSHTISGLTPGGGTIAFRSTFTPDGSKILQAGSNRLLVLNASNLTVLHDHTGLGGSFAAFTSNGGVENHDVMTTPDGKYAILSLRFQHSNSEQQDSGLQLYDIANDTTIGDPVAVCSRCHSAGTTARKTCGVDGSLTVH